jgi:hypothetical protein
MIRNATAHEDDFFAWTEVQARLLRSGQITDLDLGNRNPGWRHVIRHQRDEICELVIASPSLKPILEDLFAEAYDKARLDAADETGLPLKTFPVASPIFLIEAFDPLFPSDLGGPERELARSRN